MTIAVRRRRSPLLSAFALQMAAWGVVIGAIAAFEWHGLHLRDVSGAARLERLLWMNIGLDAGFVAMGCVLAGAAWMLARRCAARRCGDGDHRSGARASVSSICSSPCTVVIEVDDDG